MAIRDTDRGYKKRKAAIVSVGSSPHAVLIGVLGAKAAEQHKDANGKPGKETVADLATRHEFGLGVPERSFVRAYVDEQQTQIQADLSAAFRQILLGRLTVDRALGLIGAKHAAGVQKYLADGRVKPPLDPQTIARKKSSTPLVYTGQLRSAVTWLIDKGPG